MKIHFKLLCLLLVLGTWYTPTLTEAAQDPLQQPASTTLTGQIFDSQSEAPIPYASIGLLYESIGTISNEDGTFSLTIPASQHEKVVRISALGYEPKDLKVAELLAVFSKEKKVKVALVSKPIQLAEVNVNAQEWETKELGGSLDRDTKFSHSFIITPRPVKANLGRELGILINNGKKQSFLSKFNFCLRSNKYNEVKFRLNVYYLKNGKPSQNLLPKDTYVTVKNKKTGWVQVDLEPLGLYVEQDFVISLEWIDCQPKTHSQSLSIPAAMPGLQTAFHKDASQSKWHKIPATGMGMNVIVQRAP